MSKARAPRPPWFERRGTIVIIAVGLLTVWSGTARPVLAARTYILDQDAKMLSAIDTASGAARGTVTFEEQPSGLALTPDCAKLYVGTYDRSYVSVIDTAALKVIANIPVGDSPRSLAITPDGSKLYTGNVDSVDVSAIDTARDVVIARIRVGNTPVAALAGPAITPDGGKLYIANTPDNSVLVVDTATNALTRRIPVGEKPGDLVMTPGGGKVYVANLFGSGLSVIATGSDTVTTTIELGSLPEKMFLARNGKLYVAVLDEYVAVVDTSVDKVVDTIETTEGARIALSADTTRLYLTGPVICSGRAHRFAGGLICRANRLTQQFMGGMDDQVSAISTANDALIGVVPSDDPDVTRAFRMASASQTTDHPGCR